MNLQTECILREMNNSKEKMNLSGIFICKSLLLDLTVEQILVMCIWAF